MSPRFYETVFPTTVTAPAEQDLGDILASLSFSSVWGTQESGSNWVVNQIIF